MAPPRHRRKRRPSRVVTTAPPAEPELAPPPRRRGFMSAFVGPTPPVRRPAVPAGVGPPWTRHDWYVLSGLTAAVIVVIGLLIGIADNPSATVQSNHARTTTSFTVTSGSGKAFFCGQSMTVGGVQDTVQGINGDTITLADPLSSPPSSGATVTQSTTLPSTVNACGAVASSPAPTATQMSLAGGAGEDFEDSAIAIPSTGQNATIKSIDQSNFRLTLSGPLAAPLPSGTEITQRLYTVGSLIGGVVGLTISEIAIFIVAIAAILVRPLASRITKKARPKVLETLVFGAVVALVDTLVYFLEASTLASTTGTQVVLEWLLAAAAGFILVPAIYPSISRLFRPRPRPGR